MFPDGGGIVGGEGEEFCNGRPIQKVAGPDHFHPKGHGKVRGRMFRTLLMISGGEEVEGFRVEPAVGSRFAQAGFSKEDRLASFGHGGTYGGELLESMNHERWTLGMRSG